MIFNTWSFAIFALVAISIYWLVIPKQYKPLYLIIIGAIFYAFSVPAYLVLIAALSILTYGAGTVLLRVRDQRLRRALLVISVGAIVGVLAAYKYLGFFAVTVNAVARHAVLPVPHLLVPLAISFFTFEFVHVLVDVYLGKIKSLDLLEFAVFAMFFPTLVAGPIKRYESFAPQVHRITLPQNRELGLSAYRIVIGVAKKFIIADSMTTLTEPLLRPNAQPYGQLDYVVAILAYAAKIYFDFSGYSDIAIGLAGVLGIRIPENFDRPYWSQNIAVFWRRWHISLSTWIRDYIFIPMGGSRRPPLITSLNLFLAMAIAGLWHGAAWTFVCWGLWHGLGLAAHRVWSTTIAPRVGSLGMPSTLRRCVATLTTFVFVCLGWVLFAAPSFEAAALTIRRAVFGVG